jgi:hypothetical protein
LALIRHTIGRIHIKCAAENLAGIGCAVACQGADLNGSGEVDMGDLLIVIGNWSL